MVISSDNIKGWIFGVIGLIIGCVGAFIESWDLSSDLIYRYPFKIMSVPPAQYYVGVSNTLASFAPYLAMLIGLLFLLILKRRKVIAGIVPVITCPLTYILGLWYFVSNSSYRNQLQSPINYDNSSATMHHQEFYAGAVRILLFSAFVYLIFPALMYGINYWINSKKMS